MLSPAAVSHVRRAVRAALAVEGGAEPAWSWQGQVADADFAEAVARHRVSLVLADHADALGLTGRVRRAVVAQRDEERLGALAQIRLLASVDELLADIPHLFFKGAALATLTTGDPAARGEGDVDVLVPPGALAAAASAIGAAGWEVRPTYTADQGSWAWRYQRWGAHEMAFDRGTETIDLHWRLGPTYDGLPAFDELWARRAAIKVGPVEVDTLGVADTFAHSLHHAAKDGWESLRSLVDVHRLTRDPGVPHEVTDPAGVETLSAVQAALGLPAGAPRFDRTRTPLPRMLRAQAAPVRHAVVPGQRTWRQAAFRWRTSRSPRDLALNAVTLLLPPASTVTSHDPEPARAIAASVGHRLHQVSWKLAGWRTEL
ncbi:nucleotidyltransferase family protein [Nocardioides sp. MH1]|uniref:nucleotidyltransferase family protein n=1 Tax=Nocardioides sp. MH1 TaxID=3242490 RepID=UPI0035205AA3